MAEEEEIVEPLLPEPEPQELPPEREAETALEEAETDAPLREPTPLEESEESSEEEPPPPKRRAREPKAKEPKAKAEPKAKEPKAKAEPKRRGRPPGARNVVRAPVEPAQSPTAAELPAQCPMEQIMASMRERRQAHQERQHLFFQSFLP